MYLYIYIHVDAVQITAICIGMRASEGRIAALRIGMRATDVYDLYEFSIFLCFVVFFLEFSMF